MKKQIIYVNELYTILSEKGEERLKKATSKSEDVTSEEDGMPYEWYLENNLKPPKGLEPSEDEIDEEGFIHLKEDEFEFNVRDRILDIKDFRSAVEADEFGSIIQMIDGEEYHVEEDVFLIFALIEMAQRTKLERIVGYIKDKLKRNK